MRPNIKWLCSGERFAVEGSVLPTVRPAGYTPAELGNEGDVKKY